MAITTRGADDVSKLYQRWQELNRRYDETEDGSGRGKLRLAVQRGTRASLAQLRRQDVTAG